MGAVGRVVRMWMVVLGGRRVEGKGGKEGGDGGEGEEGERGLEVWILRGQS